ncbi:MAG: hypothetical protein J2P37_34580 [Ktedonobacteraceae bacterium]|nr:hypothetical protein [Ktedonobacteraceae bacterium]
MSHIQSYESFRFNSHIIMDQKIATESRQTYDHGDLWMREAVIFAVDRSTVMNIARSSSELPIS